MSCSSVRGCERSSGETLPPQALHDPAFSKQDQKLYLSVFTRMFPWFFIFSYLLELSGLQEKLGPELGAGLETLPHFQGFCKRSQEWSPFQGTQKHREPDVQPMDSSGMSPLPIFTHWIGVTPLFSAVLCEAGQVGGSVSISETSRGCGRLSWTGRRKYLHLPHPKPRIKQAGKA